MYLYVLITSATEPNRLLSCLRIAKCINTPRTRAIFSYDSLFSNIQLLVSFKDAMSVSCV